MSVLAAYTRSSSVSEIVKVHLIIENTASVVWNKVPNS